MSRASATPHHTSNSIRLAAREVARRIVEKFNAFGVPASPAESKGLIEEIAHLIEAGANHSGALGIAHVAHEAIRILCAMHGDPSQPPFEKAPAWQRHSTLENVRRILSGKITTTEKLHESWMEHKQQEGWVYGPVRDPAKKTHPCMVPFAALPRQEQAKDQLFLVVVKTLAESGFSQSSIAPAVSGTTRIQPCSQRRELRIMVNRDQQ